MNDKVLLAGLAMTAFLAISFGRNILKIYFRNFIPDPLFI